MEKTIQQIEEEAKSAFESAQDADSVQSLSTKYLGRKGELTLYLRNISSLPAEERPLAGKAANRLKKQLETLVQEKIEQIEAGEGFSGKGIDVTLPGRPVCRGFLHPVTRITDEISRIFVEMGFEIAEGPEVESDYYNFEALNFPKHHPARDMQDTFFVSQDIVLRTHTSSIQVRYMENNPPPVRIIAPGKVFRCDSDVTHTPMFHQVEGLLVDKDVSFADLKGVLTAFVHSMFDPGTALRFRPSFFPFTEPSAEVDIQCVMCRGKGCRVCSQTGWLEILGCGMVHPRVFEFVKYDTDEFVGFAFGMGVERIAMLKYGIDDLRKFFENDFRFLRQF